jgi:NADPH:quinone reductase-like Zn-dependent oxidoreductase
LHAELKSHENVLIHAAASGVGLAAIQLARFLGADTITGTASTQEKLDLITSMPNGATAGVNYKTQDFSEEIKKVGTPLNGMCGAVRMRNQYRQSGHTWSWCRCSH